MLGQKKTQKRSSTFHSFTFLFLSTGNNIRDTGATSLSESLKSNTTLTKLDLSGEDNNTQKSIHQQITLFLFAPTDNSIRDTGATSLSESLKSNTTLTKFNLSREDKRKKTLKTGIYQQITPFPSTFV